MNRPIARVFVLVLVLFALLVGLHVALDRVRSFLAALEQAQQARLLERQRISAARSSPTTGPCSPRARSPGRAGPNDLRTPLSVRQAVRPGDRLLVRRHRTEPASSATATKLSKATTTKANCRRSSTSSRQASGRGRRRHDARPHSPAGRDRRPRAATAAPSWRSNRRPGAVRVMASTPSFDPNEMRPAGASKGSSVRRTVRSSTGPPGGTRPARPSRS